MYFFRIIMLIAVFFLMNSCHQEKDNNYFYEINKELSQANQNRTKISAIHRRELEKYQRTQELKYLLSSKLSENYLITDEKSKKVSLIYELLRINDNENDFITAFCKLSLALEFESTSPKLGLQFLNEAIRIEERSENRVLLPHIYHAKGRWYYQHQNYTLAKIYFYKALKTFKKEDKLYLASMYNNFALCDNQMNDTDSAIKQTWKGLEILENKKDLTSEEMLFIYKMKGNLGYFYYSKKDYTNAEKYLTQEFDFYRYSENFEDQSVRNAGELLEIYINTHQKNKEEDFVNYLLTIEPKIKNTEMRIFLCEILQKHFADTNDLKELKSIADKLVTLNKTSNQETLDDLDNVSDILNGYIIKNINQEYDHKIETQERSSALLIILVILMSGVFVKSIFDLRRKGKSEKAVLEGLKNTLETNNVNLEKDILDKQQKIKNLHLNLHFKMETEKALLENLKKMRRKKNVNGGETVRDLFFQMSNLVKIDGKNDEFMYESSAENKEFMRILADKFPHLTEKELKLCIYLRLNLSSKEISALKNIRPGSVRVYKTKIKAKMGLEKEEFLHNFLNSIK